MDEQKKYEIIKSLADHPDGNKDRAALTLGCTKRHINRMLAGYKKYGKEHSTQYKRVIRPLILRLKYGCLWSDLCRLNGSTCSTQASKNSIKLCRNCPAGKRILLTYILTNLSANASRGLKFRLKCLHY